jgi:hypothetical protein
VTPEDTRYPSDTGRPEDAAESYATESGAPEPHASFPWPPATGQSAITAFADTWRGAALTPRRFFRALPEEGSIGAALLYYLPLGIAVAGVNLFWALLSGGIETEQDAVLGRLELGRGVSPILEFLFAPVILLASIFIAAGVTHLLLRLFGGANRDFGFTTRVFAFAYSPQILAVVPVVGTIAGFVWMVVVAVIGLKEGHRTSLGRVLAAVLIPVAIALVFIAIAAFIAATGGVLLH